MPDYTPNLNLYLPGGGGSGTIPDEIADIDKLNENFRTIDASLGGTIVPAVAGYTNRFNGNLVYARNEKKLFIESSADGGLLDVSPGANLYRGTPAERAAFAPVPEGAIWQDTDAAYLTWRGRGGAWAIERAGANNVLVKAAAASATPYALTVTFPHAFLVIPIVTATPYATTVVGSPAFVIHTVSTSGFTIEMAHNLGTRDLRCNWFATVV